MSKRGMTKRYLLIIEHIESIELSTLKNITEKIEKKGFKYSVRTFHRDLEALRDEFGVEIVYSRQQKTYYIDKALSINLNTFHRFLQNAMLSELVLDSHKNKTNIFDYIGFEAENLNTKGNDLIAEILPAISGHKTISFSYAKYYGDTKPKARTIQPYFLKEYNYRWYVAGFEKGKKEHRIFALDRIEELKINDENFKPEKKKLDYLKDGFNEVVGLAFNYGELQEVKLWFNKEQCNYAKSQPFHHSQRVIKEDEKGCTMVLKLRPNVELRLLIVKHGAHIKVLEPEWFADEVAQIHKEAAALYK
jgi:predicted DNA-binding transcriptional regulator YafY